MRRLIELSAVVVLFAACPGPVRPDERPTSGGTTPEVRTPPVPETINLDTYVWGTPLFPRGTESAYVVYLPHPTDPAQFEVLAVDPKLGKFAFHGIGHTRTAYAPTRDQINKDTASLPGNLTTITRGHGGGQSDIGPIGPPPPIPPINERAQWVWQVVSDLWRIDSAYQAAVNPATAPAR